MGNSAAGSAIPSDGHKLISVTILHRHGARGPGESELTPWDETCSNSIKSQWDESELEMITPFGHKHMVSLGQWFAQRTKKLMRESSCFWRCSKSGRARESGEDFVGGFNSIYGYDAFPKRGEPYDVDADFYFRPWKKFEAESKFVKQQCSMLHESWYEVAKEHHAFLDRICRLTCTTEKLLKQSNGLAIWSTTYFMAVKESEEFWPQEPGKEHGAIRSVITSAADWARIEEIALWVWERRFFRTGFERKIGGRITQEMLERTLNCDGSINAFSGHDYTVLAVLSNLVGDFSLNAQVSFGAYVMLQHWEGAPPYHPGLAACKRKPTYYKPTERYMRVIFNPCPFKDSTGNVSVVASEEREQVLLEVTHAEGQDIIKSIAEYFAFLEA